MATDSVRNIGKMVDRAAGKLTVRYRAIADLKLDQDNPRDHSPRQIKNISHSLTTFGFLVPVLIEGHGSVVAGHGRILAARLLGLTEVPTIEVDHLSNAQIKAFQIADNRLTETSTWNERLLSEQLKFLAESELDFSIEVVGFTMGEIDMHIEGLTPQEVDDEPDHVVDEIREVPITQAGDRWQLGDNLVACLDALNGASYENLMQRAKAAMGFADVPYNVPIEGHVSGLGSIHHRDFAMGCGEMSREQFTAFLFQIFSLLALHSLDGALHYICMDWRHMAEVLAAGERVYTELKNLCVWIKNHTGMGAFYRSRHELIFVYKHGRAPHRNNIMLGKYGRDRTNVWSYPSPRTPDEEGRLLAIHPTVKNVRMVADAILDCTARGDIVLDPCLGSGTSVIAAERTGRRCFGIEIDPHYVDSVIRRWQRYTGGQARHAGSGRLFNEVEEEAEEHNAR